MPGSRALPAKGVVAHLPPPTPRVVPILAARRPPVVVLRLPALLPRLVLRLAAPLVLVAPAAEGAAEPAADGGALRGPVLLPLCASLLRPRLGPAVWIATLLDAGALLAAAHAHASALLLGQELLARPALVAVAELAGEL